MKQDIHRWLRTGIATLTPVEVFVTDLVNYIERTGDPSLLAMTKEQAREVLYYIEEYSNSIKFQDVRFALRERIRICELQGEYSVQQKRAKRDIKNFGNPDFPH